MNSKRMNIKFCSLVWILIFVLDRITKLLALQNKYTNYVISPFVRLHTVFNQGISWGFLHDASSFTFILLSVLISSALVLLAGYAAIRWLDNRLIIGELLIISGGLSNLIDRLWYGAVVDFILFSWDSWSFPIFNIADIVIVLGVGIMFYDAWYNK